MRTSTQGGRSATRAAVAAAALLAVLLVPAQRGWSQNLSQFKVVTLDSPMVFSVNGTDVTAQSSANIASLLSFGTGSTNTIDAGFKTAGSFIDLVYTGSTPVSWGGATLQQNDTLQVFGIFGVYLLEPNASGVPATLSAPATIADWSSSDGGSGLTYHWSTTATDTGVAGYTSDSRDNNSNWMAYVPFGSYGGKDWSSSEKGQKGTFAFNDVARTTEAYLGLDIIANIIHNGSLVSDSVNTGWVRVSDLGGGSGPSSIVPEGQSSLMLACGLTPLLAGTLLLRRRRRQLA